ncbi:glycosyltransferase [Streptomyces sp. PA03-5A]|nr:glycosyltransferase [Streptomyces sp. PA03-5A]
MYLYPGGEQPLPDPPTPVTLLEGLARSAVGLLPAVLAALRRIRPHLIVHDNACLWGAVAARELGVPAASSFTTFAFNRDVPSPTRGSWDLLTAAAAHPRGVRGYLRSRQDLRHHYDTHGLPPIDLGNLRQPLNLVFTSRAFQPQAERFDGTYRFVGPSIGARPADPTFPTDRLRDPVVYASLGTVFNADPHLLRTLATALAALGGTAVVSAGRTDPVALGPLPSNVLVRPFVPQPEVLARSALFVTHGGMNSVNEALYAGVPMLVVPQGADQPMVARRVQELGADCRSSPGRSPRTRYVPGRYASSRTPASGLPRPPCGPPSGRPADTWVRPTHSSGTCGPRVPPTGHRSTPTCGGEAEPCRSPP